MALMHRDRHIADEPRSILPERWRSLLDLDLDLDGWLRMEEYQEDKDLVLRAEIPGIDPEKDVEVFVEDGRLTVHARREVTEEHKNKGDFRSEFRYGELSRSVRVPREITAADVKASYGDGILEVRVPIPTATESERTRVPVERT